jgi:hypothetical protein
MASFNASIPLSAFPDNEFDPVKNKMRLAQLLGANQENQIRAMQMSELQRQQAQQANVRSAAQGAVTPAQSSSYQEPTMQLGDMAIPGKSVGVSTPASFDQQKMYQNLLGTDPLAAQDMQGKMQAQQAESQKQQAALQEALSKADTAHVANIAAHENHISNALAPLLQMPEEQRAQMYPQIVGGLIQQGIASPQLISPTYQGADSLNQVIQRSTSAKDQAAQELERRKMAQGEQDKQNQLGSKTVDTAQGVMQLNPKTMKYDQRVGGLPPKASAAASPGATPDDPKSIAAGIMRGDLPPTVKGLYRNASPVLAELSRQGYNLQRAETDWNAVQKHISTLNGAQQTRLNQAISTASDSLDKIESLYTEYQKIAPTSGIKVVNKASLAIAKQLPGRPGAVAQALEAQIADLTSELGNVYMGGNSPTDHALGLAQKNLSSDWNDTTFREALKQAKLNLGIRRNSILNSGVVGARPDSPYLPGPQQAPQAPAGNDPFAQFGGRAH